jgi:hypothetical protein
MVRSRIFWLDNRDLPPHKVIPSHYFYSNSAYSLKRSIVDPLTGTDKSITTQAGIVAQP